MKNHEAKKYSCDNCHYFFYVDDSAEYPARCPYCSCEVVAMEMVEFNLPEESCHPVLP